MISWPRSDTLAERQRVPRGGIGAQKMYQKRLLACAKEQGKKRILILAVVPWVWEKLDGCDALPQQVRFRHDPRRDAEQLQQGEVDDPGFFKEGSIPDRLHLPGPRGSVGGRVLARNRGKVGGLSPPVSTSAATRRHWKRRSRSTMKSDGDAIMFIDNSRGYGNHVSVNVEEMKTRCIPIGMIYRR